MTYISLKFFSLVFVTFILYYALPLSKRWMALLAGSMAFYFLACKAGVWIVIITALISYLTGMYIEKNRKMSKVTLAAAIAAVSIPWFLTKNFNTIWVAVSAKDPIGFIIPMGISFYTLELIAYMVDVYKEKVKATANPLKFLLFVSFFPHIVQGPIPRYEKLSDQLFEGHLFSEDDFMHGILYIAWGFFLKLMIADKAAVVVNPIFNDYMIYRGSYVLIGGMLYSIQLYADFSACICISKGVSKLFGINLDDNFNHPYFAVSIKDFWRRWHISLSLWLRDYIYIPLGGSRCSRVRKYINLATTFFISGVWHGAGLNFILWGLLHAVYQIVGEVTKPVRDKVFELVNIEKDSEARLFLSRVWTYICVMFAWIIFRAESLSVAFKMIGSISTVHNKWILTDDSLFALGLSNKEWIVLLVSVAILYRVSKKQEQGEKIADKLIGLPLLLRWAFLLIVFFGIMTFGTYGMGYDAKDFIYGGF